MTTPTGPMDPERLADLREGLADNRGTEMFAVAIGALSLVKTLRKEKAAAAELERRLTQETV